MANVSVDTKDLLAKIGEQAMIIAGLKSKLAEQATELSKLRQLELDVERGKVCTVNHD